MLLISYDTQKVFKFHFSMDILNMTEGSGNFLCAL